MFKMEVSIDQASSCQTSIDNSNWSVRKNQFDSQLIYGTCLDISLDLIEQRYSEIRYLVPGRCYSIQMFFKGQLPNEITSGGQFKKVPNEKFYRLFHPYYLITAIPIESTGIWIISLMCRKGAGLRINACDLTNMFAEQMVLKI